MSKIAEDNQFFKGKKDILDEFSANHGALLSAVAGRNFLKLPGFLQEASIQVEEIAKNKLSALNYQILSEAINRELTQSGHDYTQAYKAARIAFELEKQTLLNALQDEFKAMDLAYSITEEDLNRLFVELDVRKILLITSKTAIDLQMEGLKQQLLDIDRLTFTKETQLINEKIATATAKLGVIPHVEALILAQERVLSAEEGNLTGMGSLIDVKGLFIDKQYEVLPYIQDKATARLALASKKEEVLPYIVSKADEQVNLANKKQEILSYIERKIDAQTDLAGVEQELLAYIEDKIDARVLLIASERGLLPYMEEKSLARQQLSFKQESLAPHILEKASSIISLANKEIELLPKYVDKATASLALAGANDIATGVKEQRLAVAVERAVLKSVAIEGTLDMLSADVATEALRRELSLARTELTTAKVNRQIAVSAGRTENLGVLAAEHSGLTSSLINYRVAIASGVRSAKAAMLATDIAGDEEANVTSVNADEYSTRLIASYSSNATRETANAAANAKITNQLIHILGS